MTRVGRRIGNVTNPLIVIQWIIALISLVAGVYMVSPLLQLSIDLHGKSAFVATVGSNYGVVIFGCVFILSALLMIAGIVYRRVGLRSGGLFLNGLCRFYSIIATILAVGILPFTWASNALVMIIVFYIWSRIRKRGAE